jgi:hypothetical protein
VRIGATRSGVTPEPDMTKLYTEKFLPPLAAK